MGNGAAGAGGRDVVGGEDSCAGAGGVRVTQMGEAAVCECDCEGRKKSDDDSKHE